MQSGSECCPQGHVALMSPSDSLMLVLLLLLLPLPLGGGEQLTRSVGKAPTTSSHLLTTSARFCYTKCAEVCSRMRLSIRHVAHQNGFFAVSGISFLSLSPPLYLCLCLLCPAVCLVVCFLYFLACCLAFWATFINRNAWKSQYCQIYSTPLGCHPPPSSLQLTDFDFIAQF